MASIRTVNTRPEVLVRKALFARGFRYRVHQNTLPGKPDIVFRKYRAAIFVHGCFWHGHSCRLFKWPATRKKFWADKIKENRRRDLFVGAQLLDAGWRVGTVWECSIKGQSDKQIARVIARCAKWLSGKRRSIDLGSR